MNETYTVVMTDGTEKLLDLETIKNYYLTRQLQETSLIFVPENGGWKTLKTVFNLAEWGERSAFVVRQTSPTAQAAAIYPTATANHSYNQHHNYQQPNNCPTSYQQQPNYQYSAPSKPANSGNTVLFSVLGVGLIIITLVVIGGFVVLQKAAQVSEKISENVSKYNKLREYELPEKEFTDPVTKAKIKIPDNWLMIKTSNPIITSNYAKMVAMDEKANSGVMLEIVPFPTVPKGYVLDQSKLGDFDMLLDKAFLEIQSRGKAVETSRMPTVLGNQRAKKLNYTMQEDSTNYDGVIILTKDSSNFYVLEFSCLQRKTADLQPDFDFIERSVFIPTETIK